MSLREVFDYRTRCIVWVTVIIALTNVFFHSSGAVGQNTKLAFDEKKDVEVVRIVTNDNNEEMVASASDIDRGYSHRVKFFDDIFNIPISVLQNVNNLIQGMFGRPAGYSVRPAMAASGWGRSSDVNTDKDSKV